MSLSTLFNPKSIAVIGASTTPGAVGYIIVQNLLDEHYPGKVFPVNPKTDTLLGIPCYAKIKAIREAIDLAIIVVPASLVPSILQEVAEAMIKDVIIISAGFREAGVNGKVLEKQIEDMVTAHGITLLGPNCLGFLHSSRCLNASFARTLPKPGNITFFSQSGALCTTILDETVDTLGYAHFVSTGNKTTLQEAELLEYFLDDSETEVIAFYTEELEDAQSLIKKGTKAILSNPPKPIIVLKGGSTEEGSTASSSHTGAVTGNDHAYETLFRQSFIHRARNLNHLRAMLQVFSQNPIPEGNRIAIITNAGGMGVLATDVASRNGLVMAPLHPATVQDLNLRLPTAASAHNPIDVLGDALAERYELALQLVSQDLNVDMILVIVTPQAMTEAEKTAEVMIKIRSTCKKPLVAAFTKGKALEKGVKLLQETGLSVLSSPEEAALALSNFARIPAWQQQAQKQVQSTNREKQNTTSSGTTLETKDENGYLEESVARHLLEKSGFCFPKTVTVTSESELVSARNFFTGPVVMKILSPDIIHKSDAGGVLLNVAPKKIEESYEQLLKAVKERSPKAKVTGVSISEMITSYDRSQEILLGIKDEPGLGKLIVVGLGGVYVEVTQDVTSRFAPVTTETALEMIHELRSAPLFTGIRGQKGIDTDVLAKYMVALSDVALSHPEIRELDINPFVSTEDGSFLCLDARIRI